MSVPEIYHRPSITSYCTLHNRQPRKHTDEQRDIDIRDAYRDAITSTQVKESLHLEINYDQVHCPKAFILPLIQDLKLEMLGMVEEHKDSKEALETTNLHVQSGLLSTIVVKDHLSHEKHLRAQAEQLNKILQKIQDGTVLDDSEDEDSEKTEETDEDASMVDGDDDEEDDSDQGDDSEDED